MHFIVLLVCWWRILRRGKRCPRRKILLNQDLSTKIVAIWIQKCPEGYLFDPLLRVCVSEELASCLPTTTSAETMMPTSGPITTTSATTTRTTVPSMQPTTSEKPFVCPGGGLYPSVDDGCSNEFWSCQDGEATLEVQSPYEMQCFCKLISYFKLTELPYWHGVRPGVDAVHAIRKCTWLQ